jgi:hypothetical protein
LARFEQMSQQGFMWEARVVGHFVSEAMLNVYKARVWVSQNHVDDVAGLSHNGRLPELRRCDGCCFVADSFCWRMHLPVGPTSPPGSRQQKSMKI